MPPLNFCDFTFSAESNVETCPLRLPGIDEDWIAHSGLWFHHSPAPARCTRLVWGNPLGLRSCGRILLFVSSSPVVTTRTLLRLRNRVMWTTLLQVRPLDNSILHILFIQSQKAKHPEVETPGCSVNWA